MKVDIKTIPHNEQRYETIGDWWEDEYGLHIRVSDMKNEWYEHMVAMHEYFEWLLCKRRKISEESVSDFDIKFEQTRQEGNTEEPGDDPLAPYHDEHCAATGVERILCSMLGLSWKTYDETVTSLL